MFNPDTTDFQNTPASDERPPFDYRPALSDVEPEITIVTPFYNEGPVFHETARSVFRQSFQLWKWIIVNDASTNGEALEVLHQYRTRDPRILIIDQIANGGPSAARNVAFRLARTPYVAHLDSDNLLEPTALEKWLWFLESYPEYAFVKGFTIGFGAETYLSSAGFHEGEAFLTANRVDTTSLIRTNVHRAVGGFDESIREGLEDWEFWLRCASHGYWGGSVPEVLDWYRRRRSHGDRWRTWDSGPREHRFGQELRRKFPALWEFFPKVRLREHLPYSTVPDELPSENLLAKATRRLVLIVPWLVMGGSDKFMLDVVRELSAKGWEITVATTLEAPDSWLAQFGKYTPDIFPLHRFLRLVDYPRFLRYLIRSRHADAVVISHSELGYQLLPYLRAHFPGVPFLDYCHIEEEWKNGGYPRQAVEMQELLDLNVVSSEHLKQWMVNRGAEADRIEVCYTSIDTDNWQPDSVVRSAVRAEIGLSSTVPVILFAGRLCDQKQPQVLAGTLRKLQEANADFVALIAGDGPEFAWLQRFVAKHSLDSRVRLLRAQPSERINQLMKAADIFFLPSAWEGIAISVYEAMASGLAVVGAKVGGQEELITPDTGILIERKDAAREIDEYSKILIELTANPAHREALGKAARDRVAARFELRNMANRLVALIDKATRLHSAQPRPVPGVGLGRATAAQTIELTRTVREFDKLWHTWHSGSATFAPATAVTDPSWRDRVYAACRVLYGPLYRRGLERGGAWYFPIANRIKASLLQPR